MQPIGLLNRNHYQASQNLKFQQYQPAYQRSEDDWLRRYWEQVAKKGDEDEKSGKDRRDENGGPLYQK